MNDPDATTKGLGDSMTCVEKNTVAPRLGHASQQRLWRGIHGVNTAEGLIHQNRTEARG